LQNHYVGIGPIIPSSIFSSPILRLWWDHIVALALGNRYGIKTRAPRDEGWGIEVAGVVDPSGVLWRIQQVRDTAAD
jgi:hypothetical protein